MVKPQILRPRQKKLYLLSILCLLPAISVCTSSSSSLQNPRTATRKRGLESAFKSVNHAKKSSRDAALRFQNFFAQSQQASMQLESSALQNTGIFNGQQLLENDWGQEAVSFFHYKDLANLMGVSKRISSFAEANCMPQGKQLIAWLSRNPSLAHIEKRLYQSPNPIPMLQHAAMQYFVDVPPAERLFDFDARSQQVIPGQLTTVKNKLINLNLRLNAIQEPEQFASQKLQSDRDEAMMHIMPAFERLRPYATCAFLSFILDPSNHAINSFFHQLNGDAFFLRFAPQLPLQDQFAANPQATTKEHIKYLKLANNKLYPYLQKLFMDQGHQGAQAVQKLKQAYERLGTYIHLFSDTLRHDNASLSVEQNQIEDDIIGLCTSHNAKLNGLAADAPTETANHQLEREWTLVQSIVERIDALESMVANSEDNLCKLQATVRIAELYAQLFGMTLPDAHHKTEYCRFAANSYYRAYQYSDEQDVTLLKKAVAYGDIAAHVQETRHDLAFAAKVHCRILLESNNTDDYEKHAIKALEHFEGLINRFEPTLPELLSATNCQIIRCRMVYCGAHNIQLKQDLSHLANAIKLIWDLEKNASDSVYYKWAHKAYHTIKDAYYTRASEKELAAMIQELLIEAEHLITE